MKTEGRLDRDWLKGAIGDAVLCGAGHNIRLLLKKLRLLCVRSIRELLRFMGFGFASLAGA